MRPVQALLLGLCVSVLPLRAQSLRMPGVRVAGTPEAVAIRELRIEVQVTGTIATTTWDLTVFNPQDRVLEGELIFPLAEGQTVSRFALDVNGSLREGVVVEKAKGRQVFEAIVRRGVDPGLLEKTEGNAFRARVYPVPARGTRRLVIAYEQELPFGPSGTGKNLRFHLPFDFKAPIPRFSFRVQVREQDLEPRLDSSPLSTFAFRKGQRAYLAEETQENALLNKPLTVLIPRAPEAASVFLDRTADAAYFAVALAPELPKEPKPLPRRLLLLFDASASAAKRDLGKEFALLDAYFRRLGSCQVRLAIFRDTPEAIRSFEVRNGRWAELRQALEQAPLDGATAFGRLDLAALPVDETLLLSDGLNTFGPAEPRLPAVPLTAISSAAHGDPARLRALAEGRGGEWIDLDRSTPAEALAALTTRPLAFLRATCEPGAVEEVYPSGGQVLRGSFLLAGRLLKPKAKLTLHFGFGGVTRFTRTVTLAEMESSAAPVRRLWAQKKLAELERDRSRNAKAILALGKAFGLVTDGTSLIVLEDVQDYAQNDIQPPPELRGEFERLRGQHRADERRRVEQHLEAVLRQFQERQQWWAMEFKPKPPEPRPTESRQAAATVEVRAEARADHPSAMPPPSPAPVGDRERQALAKSSAKNGHDASKPAEALPRATIELKAWTPETPYLKELEAAEPGTRYSAYLRLREAHGGTPGFFLDVSDLFERNGEKALARRILSNLAELKPEDPELLRILGWRLQQLGELTGAVWTLEEVLRIREEEPQSRRDLALALAARGEFQRAAELLWEVVATPGDGRFRDIHLIAASELNALLAQAHGRVDPIRIDPRFLAAMPVDIRVVLNWDTPNSDMDLHVTDPQGETCYYGHQKTGLGGRISADVTQGYGPEEFLLKKAMPGRYQIKAKFFGTRQQTVVGATTVKLELYLRYATGRMENKSALLRLSGPGRMVDVGEFVFEKD